MKEEISGNLLFCSRILAPSTRPGSEFMSLTQSLPQATSLRMCGVRVTWEVGLKLSRCSRPHLVVKLNLEDEDDVLFGGEVDFTDALVGWDRASDDAAGGGGDSVLILVPELYIRDSPASKKMVAAS